MLRRGFDPLLLRGYIMKNVMTDKALKTRRLVVCAALCALSFVFLLIGAVTDVLDLTMLMLSSFCITFAVIEIGGRWAWLRRSPSRPWASPRFPRQTARS